MNKVQNEQIQNEASTCTSLGGKFVWITCRDYLERRATHYTAQIYLPLPAYVADLIRLSK